MYIDKELLISDGQDLGQIEATYKSDHSVDLGAVRDIGKGKQLNVVIVVDEAFVGAGATLDISLISDDLATLASPTVILSLPQLAVDDGDLTLGRVPLVIPIPPGIAEQHIGLQYVIGGATTTKGTITAFIAFDYQSNW